MENSILAKRFIDEIWNNQAFDQLSAFLHDDYKDLSLAPSLSPDKEGTKKWILATGASFEHHTTIEGQVTEGDQSIVRIKMKLKHIGVWRGIEPTGVELYTIGYRHFKFSGGKIIEHWALIDGQAVESQLNGNSHGCAVGR